MDILFIWFGKSDPLYEWRDACIRRAFEMYPEANFKCITTLKDFYGMELIDANELCTKMESEGYYSDIDNFMALSDEMRFYWLARNKNTLYLDTDTYCSERFELSALPRKAGIEALWSGDDCGPFEIILKIRDKGQFFINLESTLNIAEMNHAFEHKPQWSRELRETKGDLMPSHKVRDHAKNRLDKLKKAYDIYQQLKDATAKALDAVLTTASVLDFQPEEVNCILGYKFIKENHK